MKLPKELIVLTLMGLIILFPFYAFKLDVKNIEESYLHTLSYTKIDNHIIINNGKTTTIIPDTDWEITTFEGETFIDTLDEPPSINDVYKKTVRDVDIIFRFTGSRMSQRTEINYTRQKD